MSRWSRPAAARAGQAGPAGGRPGGRPVTAHMVAGPELDPSVRVGLRELQGLAAGPAVAGEPAARGPSIQPESESLTRR